VKRSNGFLNFILIIVVAAVIIFAVLKKHPSTMNDTVPEETNKTEEITVTAAAAENDEETTAANDSAQNDYYHALLSDYEFWVLSARISKECDLANMEQPRDESITIDNGRLLGDYSYLFIEIEMKNNFTIEKETTMNNHKLKIMSGSTLVDKQYIYMTDKNQDRIGKRDYLHFILQPEEKEIITLIYIIQDSYIDDTLDLVLCLDPMGQDGTRVNFKSNNGDEGVLNTDDYVANIVVNKLIDEVTY
jgi:hypothetical protein